MSAMLKIGAFLFLALGMQACSSIGIEAQQNNNDATVNFAEQEPTIALGPVYGNPGFGSPESPVSVVMFQDLTCGMCRAAFREFVTPFEESPEVRNGEVRFIFAEYPLGLFADDTAFAVAAKCADDQGEYLRLIDQMYHSPAKTYDAQNLERLAKDSGLNVSQFSQCMKSQEAMNAVLKDFAIGKSLQVKGTPTFFIDGEKSEGFRDFDTLRRQVRAALSSVAK